MTTETTNPQHSNIRRAARDQFDRWALSYDRSRLNELVFFPTVRTCQEEISRWRSERGGRPYDVLDVGCGTGTLLSCVARDPAANRLVGLDYSPVMLTHFREKVAAAPLGEKMHAVQGDAERLPFDEATFDVVTCCNSFHHYPHQPAAVQGFHRVLRPGGLLILVDGFRDNLIGWLIFDVCVTMAEGGVHHAAWSHVRNMLGDAGFADVRQRKMNVLAPLLVSLARR